MPVTPQVALLNDFGAELTVGIKVNGDRMACVFPMVTDAAGALTDITRMRDCVEGFEAGVLTGLEACMSSDAEITFLQAEGMVDGVIPYRLDYMGGAHPGTLASGCLPSNCCGLLYWYENPADVAAGKKMRVAHNYIPGVPESMVSGDIINSTLALDYSTLALLLANGWATAIGGSKWFRYLSAPWQMTANPSPPPAMIRTRPRGIQVPRVSDANCRNYIATQRRRMVPH